MMIDDIKRFYQEIDGINKMLDKIKSFNIEECNDLRKMENTYHDIGEYFHYMLACNSQLKVREIVAHILNLEVAYKNAMLELDTFVRKAKSRYYKLIREKKQMEKKQKAENEG